MLCIQRSRRHRMYFRILPWKMMELALEVAESLRSARFACFFALIFLSISEDHNFWIWLTLALASHLAAVSKTWLNGWFDCNVTRRIRHLLPEGVLIFFSEMCDDFVLKSLPCGHAYPCIIPICFSPFFIIRNQPGCAPKWLPSSCTARARRF